MKGINLANQMDAILTDIPKDIFVIIANPIKLLSFAVVIAIRKQ